MHLNNSSKTQLHTFKITEESSHMTIWETTIERVYRLNLEHHSLYTSQTVHTHAAEPCSYFYHLASVSLVH